MAGDQDPQNRQRYGRQKKILNSTSGTSSTTTKATGSTSVPRSKTTPVSLRPDANPISSKNTTSSMATVPPRVDSSSTGARNPPNPDIGTNVGKKIKVGNSVIRMEAKETIKIPMNQISRLYQTLKNRFEN